MVKKGNCSQEWARCCKTLQRNFETVECRAGTYSKNLFVIDCEGSKDLKQVWAVKVLLQFRAYAGREKIEEELTFIKHIKYSHPIDETDPTLGFTFLRNSMDDEKYQMTDLWTFLKRGRTVMIEERLG